MSRLSPEEFKEKIIGLNNVKVKDVAAILGMSEGAIQNNISRRGLHIYVINKTIQVIGSDEKLDEKKDIDINIATRHQNRIPLIDDDFDHISEMSEERERRKKYSSYQHFL